MSKFFLFFCLGGFSFTTHGYSPVGASLDEFAQVTAMVGKSGLSSYVFTFDSLTSFEKLESGVFLLKSKMGCEVQLRAIHKATQDGMVGGGPIIERLEILSAIKSQDPRIKDNRGCSKELKPTKANANGGRS